MKREIAESLVEAFDWACCLSCSDLTDSQRTKVFGLLDALKEFMVSVLEGSNDNDG